MHCPVEYGTLESDPRVSAERKIPEQDIRNGTDVIANSDN